MVCVDIGFCYVELLGSMFVACFTWLHDSVVLIFIISDSRCQNKLFLTSQRHFLHIELLLVIIPTSGLDQIII